MDDLRHLLSNPEDTEQEILDWIKADPKHLLYCELMLAEMAARKGGKRKTFDTHGFEINLFENVMNLAEDLWNGTYAPSRGTAHIIMHPVQREIFAAPYRDRVVHHFVCDATMPWWETRFCQGSCSCRVEKGTQYGIRLLDHYIRSVSNNLKDECVVAKFDITGYFMHINREVLWERVLWGLKRQYAGNYGKRYQILKQVFHAVIFDDPVSGVKIQGSYRDWEGLPEDKSLFCQPPGQGMVIGNLTSQFCSNIYLDVIDRFITLELGYKKYVRYVDDLCIVVRPDEVPKLQKDVRAIEDKLAEIGLTLNRKKTKYIPSWQGVPFLGMVVKRGRIVPGKRMTKNFLQSAREVVIGKNDPASIVSYLGMLKNYDAEKVADKIFKEVGWEYYYD